MSALLSLLMVAVALPFILGGCESLGRGAAQGVMQAMNEPAEDTRLCDVEGKPFDGVLPFLVKQDGLPPIGEVAGPRPEAKIIYVRGTLMLNIAMALDLNVRSPRPKRIEIASPAFFGQVAGRAADYPADQRTAAARPALLRADLIAHHAAGQGHHRLRQGPDLSGAPGFAEPGHAKLRPRHCL